MKQVIIANVRLANNWLDIIGTCEMNIKANNNAEYFKGVKAEAEEKFCESVRALAENFALCSNEVPTLAFQK